jgi:hypothetical protein
MSATFPFKRIGEHLFAEVEGELLLVDTGTPDSFSEGRGRSIVSGLRIENQRSSFVDAAEMQRRLKVPVVGILGMDLMRRCDVVFDLPAGALTLTLAAQPQPEAAHALRSRMGVPVFDLPYEDGLGSSTTDIPVFLDSGARYSYLSPDRIAATKLGRVEDYSPVLGPLVANLYRASHRAHVVPGRFRVPMHFAEPPRALSTLMDLAGVEGILGVEAFDNTVLMSMREGWLARA